MLAAVSRFLLRSEAIASSRIEGVAPSARSVALAALVHTVLTRRGHTPTAVLPVSMVLSTFRESYLDGLTGYRYRGEPDTAEAVEGVGKWVAFFVGSATAAAEQSRSVLEDITALQRDWEQRLATARISRGLRARPRTDSATRQILDILPSAPVLTSRVVQRVLGVSPKAALEALAELTAAGILQTRRIAPSATAYLAGELLDLITFAERRLASTRFDTRASSPRPPVPARPDDRWRSPSPPSPCHAVVLGDVRLPCGGYQSRRPPRNRQRRRHRQGSHRRLFALASPRWRANLPLSVRLVDPAGAKLCALPLDAARSRSHSAEARGAGSVWERTSGSRTGTSCSASFLSAGGRTNSHGGTSRT